MILRNDVPLVLDPEKVRHLKNNVMDKDGIVLVRLHDRLAYTETVADAKMRRFTRKTYPPSVEVETTAIHHTPEGSITYRYVETRVPVKGGFRNLPSGIDIKEGGKTVKNLEMLYFLYYFCPSLEGGAACDAALKADPSYLPLLKIYDENLEAKKEMSSIKIKSKVEYLISNEWDTAKLLTICNKLFIDVPENASKERLQKEITGYLSAKTNSDKYEVFLNAVDKREATVDAESISLYVDQGIFVRQNRDWLFVADGKKEKLFELRPTQLGIPTRTLYEYCLKFPSVAARATVEYNKILQKQKPEITSETLDLAGDGERFNIGGIDEVDEITADEAMQMVDDIARAISLDIVTKQGNVFKYKQKSLGKDQESIYEKLLKAPEMLADIRKDMLVAEAK